MKRKQGVFFSCAVLLIAVIASILLTITLAGCDALFGGDDDRFVPVTDINGPSLAITGRELTLIGSVVPANATNQTITWSGNEVAGGKFTAASAGNSYEVTATIVNGTVGGVDFEKKFTIEVVDGGSGVSINPFGTDAVPVYWAMDDNPAMVYVEVKSAASTDAWTAWGGGSPYNTGGYEWFNGTNTAQWKVITGGYTGDTGLAFIQADGKMRVANLVYEYSAMNGTFTKLNTSFVLTGTWIDSEGPFGDVKIAANSGNFTISIGPGSGMDVIKGTYPTSGTTNPAVCTITEVNTAAFGDSGGWKLWANLGTYQNYFGGSPILPVLIYGTNPNDKCEIFLLGQKYTPKKQ
ncbi:MAG: hypothetical protein LBJ24_02665 [Treponema sp.]|jgi:hypothetical protein|nr:hypothetical protein [Treponema sp.]